MVQTDDTPVPVLDPELPRTRTGPDLDLRRGCDIIPTRCTTTPPIAAGPARMSF